MSRDASISFALFDRERKPLQFVDKIVKNTLESFMNTVTDKVNWQAEVGRAG